MKGRHVVIAGVALAVVLVPAALLAGGMGWHGPRDGGFGMGRDGFGMLGFGMGGMRGRLAQRLGLTDAQKAQIKSILQTERPNLQAARQAIRAAVEQFAATQTPGAFDEAAVRAAVSAREPLIENMAVVVARTRSEIYNVLTQDQQAKLKQLRQEFAAKHGSPGSCTAPSPTPAS